MRLNHNRLGASRKDRKPFRRFAPVAATIALAAMSLFAKAQVKPPDSNIVYAGVEKLGDSVAGRHLTKPAEVKDGKVKGILIMVPLLSKKDSYLVLKLPTAAVDELMEHISTLPKEERAGIVTDWVIRNQKLMLEEYIKSGRKDAFSFNLASIVPGKEPGKASPVPELRREKDGKAHVVSTAPLSPEIKGGEGTEEDPIKLHIPVPVTENGLVGSALYSVGASIPLSGRSIHINTQFVGVASPSGSKPRTTTARQLSARIRSVLIKPIERIYAKMGGQKEDITYNILENFIKGFVMGAGSRHEAIRRYIPN